MWLIYHLIYPLSVRYDFSNSKIILQLRVFSLALTAFLLSPRFLLYTPFTMGSKIIKWREKKKRKQNKQSSVLAQYTRSEEVLERELPHIRIDRVCMGETEGEGEGEGHRGTLPGLPAARETTQNTRLQLTIKHLIKNQLKTYFCNCEKVKKEKKTRQSK